MFALTPGTKSSFFDVVFLFSTLVCIYSAFSNAAVSLKKKFSFGAENATINQIKTGAFDI
jgi:hypothetical protein